MRKVKVSHAQEAPEGVHAVRQEGPEAHAPERGEAGEARQEDVGRREAPAGQEVLKKGVNVRFNQTFTLNGRTYVKGESYTVEPQLALQLGCWLTRL